MMSEKVNSSDVDKKVDNKPQLHEVTDALPQAEGITAAVNAGQSNDPKHGAPGSVSTCSSSFVEKEQPKPVSALLPPSMEPPHTVCEETPASTRSLKTTSAHAEPDKEDLCASILLACLFCHPLDCLLATTRGCSECLCSLCSYYCGCSPGTLQPLLDLTHHCDLCSDLGERCGLCDCTLCEICLQATECLDLLMEISQMLYH